MRLDPWNWNPWFAWYPVVSSDGTQERWVWLRKVWYRRFESKHDDGVYWRYADR